MCSSCSPCPSLSRSRWKRQGGTKGVISRFSRHYCAAAVLQMMHELTLEGACDVFCGEQGPPLRSQSGCWFRRIQKREATFTWMICTWILVCQGARLPSEDDLRKSRKRLEIDHYIQLLHSHENSKNAMNFNLCCLHVFFSDCGSGELSRNGQGPHRIRNALASARRLLATSFEQRLHFESHFAVVPRHSH